MCPISSKQFEGPTALGWTSRMRLVNLKWLPNPTDLEDAANNICTAAIYIIAYANEFFGDGGTPQSLADAWQSYKGLVEAS